MLRIYGLIQSGYSHARSNILVILYSIQPQFIACSCNSVVILMQLISQNRKYWGTWRAFLPYSEVCWYISLTKYCFDKKNPKTKQKKPKTFGLSDKTKIINYVCPPANFYKVHSFMTHSQSLYYFQLLQLTTHLIFPSFTFGKKQE